MKKLDDPTKILHLEKCLKELIKLESFYGSSVFINCTAKIIAARSKDFDDKQVYVKEVMELIIDYMKILKELNKED